MILKVNDYLFRLMAAMLVLSLMSQIIQIKEAKSELLRISVTKDLILQLREGEQEKENTNFNFVMNFDVDYRLNAYPFEAQILGKVISFQQQDLLNGEAVCKTRKNECQGPCQFLGSQVVAERGLGALGFREFSFELEKLGTFIQESEIESDIKYFNSGNVRFEYKNILCGNREDLISFNAKNKTRILLASVPTPVVGKAQGGFNLGDVKNGVIRGAALSVMTYLVYQMLGYGTPLLVEKLGSVLPMINMLPFKDMLSNLPLLGQDSIIGKTLAYIFQNPRLILSTLGAYWGDNVTGLSSYVTDVTGSVSPEYRDLFSLKTNTAEHRLAACQRLGRENRICENFNSLQREVDTYCYLYSGFSKSVQDADQKQWRFNIDKVKKKYEELVFSSIEAQAALKPEKLETDSLAYAKAHPWLNFFWQAFCIYE